MAIKNICKIAPALSTFLFCLLLNLPVHAKEIQTGMFGLWAYPVLDDGLQLVKNNGFGVVVMDATASRIDKAGKLGLGCIVDFKFTAATTKDPVKWQKYLTDLKNKVKELKDNPAVFAWYPVDEPDGQNISLAHIKQARDAIRSVDTKHPIFTVLNTPAQWYRYLPYFDIPCVDPYLAKRNPLTGKPDTVDKVTDWVKRLKGDLKRLKLNKPAWVALHAFELIPKVPGYKDWYQIVTPAQFNTMVDLALAEGADGVLPYTLATVGSSDYQDWILPKNDPPLWDAVRSLPQRVKNKK